MKVDDLVDYLYIKVDDRVDYLNIKVDDWVDYLCEVEDGWYKGRLKGRVGVFPSNFVEVRQSNTYQCSEV